MPINAYVGWPGAGKTYQVVSNVIIPQIANGRSIVTNIDGIDVDAVYENIFCRNRGKIVCLGTIRTITNEDLADSSFLFPREMTEREKREWIKQCEREGRHDIEYRPLVQSGEMIVIDEAANWWGNDCQIKPEHGRFFREHRHYVDPFTHESCDMVIIVQEITDLKRSLKNLIQYTFRAEKLDVIGQDKRYKLHMYRGAKVGERYRPLRSDLGQYKPEIYACYDSYGGGKGKEKSIDARHNVLNDKKLKYKAIGILSLILILGGWGYSQVSSFFRGNTPADKMSSNSPSEKKAAQPAPSPAQANPQSSDWRLIGKYGNQANKVFLLQAADGQYRQYVPGSRSNLFPMAVKVDGVTVSLYSGASQKGIAK